MSGITRREFLKTAGAVAAFQTVASGFFSNSVEATEGSTTAQSNAAISLPKGGGAIRGIGETFQPNLFTGTGNFSVPIVTSPGRNGFGPKLNLQYSTGNGNGPFGLGWQLSIPRISRKTEKGIPTYTDEDVFLMSGAEDLVPAINSPGMTDVPGFTITRYRPRTEGLFARIEKWVGNDGDIHWRVTSKENVTSIYGKSRSARIEDPDDSRHIFEWFLEETFDAKGNHILYEYVQEDSNLALAEIYEKNRKHCQTYIRRILYGNTPDDLSPAKKVGPERTATHHRTPSSPLKRHYVFEVIFDYGDFPDNPQIPYDTSKFPDKTSTNDWPIREDPFSTFRSGFEIRTLRRVRRVLMLHHFKDGEVEGAPLVKSTDFSYEINEASRISFLSGVTVLGYRKDPKKLNTYFFSDMPPVTFGYSEFKPQEQHYKSVIANLNDFPPKGLKDPNYTLIDLNGNGLPDILNTTSNGYYFWQNLGDGTIDQRHVQHSAPGLTLDDSNIALGDLGGDGLADMLVEGTLISGFYETKPDGNWRSLRRSRIPNIPLADPNIRLVDLTGDGLSDILFTTEDYFVWFQCLGGEGYGDPHYVKRKHNLEEFPDVFFGDLDQRVRLADMNGDGLNDIVLIHDGRIDYWPNLGYGRFGARTTMENAPHFGYDFDPKRLFLVDLDGTGCADLVYVEFDRVRFWFNQSGNSWSAEQHPITGTPKVNNLMNVRFADFFGTGTATIVWSYDYDFQPGGNYKILDFCGGAKPHLLTEMSNNMGATTRVQYAPSTKFYLEDRQAGNPWITTLPFPVHVLEKTEVIDHVSKTKLVTTYKYHHGYYDGREREFRGFGRVDQYDTEEFETFAGSSLHIMSELTNNQRAFHVPPILTKTWFHTGIYFDENISAADGLFYDHVDMMEAFNREFYKEDKQAFVLEDNIVEIGATPHDGYRALRGSIVRSEVYSLDGTDNAVHPYKVCDTRYDVKELQPKDVNNNGVYLVTQKESLAYDYERNSEDPRVSHQLTLAVDSFGNVTDSASIGYPRRVVRSDLLEQGEIKILYTRSDFINNIDAASLYYGGVQCQTRSYEVTGINWASGQPHLNIGDFRVIMDAGIAPGNFKPHEWDRPNDHIGVEKRIVEWTRSYFRKNSAASGLDIDPNLDPIRTLAMRLQLGEIESLGLPYESYQAVFTNDFLKKIFNGPDDQSRVTTTMIIEGGYHVEPDLPNQWWIPSGQQAFNTSKFYLAEKSRDSFGKDILVHFDDYGLLTLDATDKAQNFATALNDYRVLQPFRIIDPNKNISEVAFDVLGMVVGTALSGIDEAASPIGDSISGFNPDLDPNNIDLLISDPFNTPQKILGNATTRLVYSLKQYMNHQKPNVIYTMARETHHSDEHGEPTKIQHRFVYSDGFGREVQTKVPAEPDPLSMSPGQSRWVGTGTKVYNNKGKTVQQFEPFFSDTHQFGIEKDGVSPILFYDPLDHVICTVHPNHTYEKVTFNPWLQKTWDANDTIHPDHRFNPVDGLLPDPSFDPVNDPDVGSYLKRLDQNDYHPTWYYLRMDHTKATEKWPDPITRLAEKRSAQKAAKHAATPSISYFDSLGHIFLEVADNGKDHSGKDVYFTTRIELDIHGNKLKITDPQGVDALKYVFDMAGRKCSIFSVDAGLKLALLDVAGNNLYAWDANGHVVYTKYDAMRRPTEQWIKNPGASQYFLAQKTIYGEAKPTAETTHHRGQVWRVYDGAGLLENEYFDFKGNLRRTTRNLPQNGQSQVQWASSADPWNNVFDATTATSLVNSSEEETFMTKTDFDALNRVTRSEVPDGTAHEFTYNEANLPKSIRMVKAPATKAFVENIDYNAKGQRTKIKYANGVTTKYAYDMETFRLIRIDTKRQSVQAPKELQDLTYFYDPAGNITEIRDDAHVRIFNSNNLIDPVCRYTYDAVYRLIEATGREHEAVTACHYRESEKKQTEFIQLSDQPINNGQSLCNYIEKYQYDTSGNITQIAHHNLTSDIRWTRLQTYDNQSNRLKTSHAGCQDDNTYDFLAHHDLNGNIVGMPHLPQIKWNHQNQLIEVQLNEGPNPSKAYYQYDGNGQRVRKTIVRNGRTEERIYIAGYEIYKERNGTSVTLRRDTIHIFDDKDRISLIEDEKNPVDGSLISRHVRYQLSNHLGSSHLEVDDSSDAKIISYEEYSPNGETVYMAGSSWSEVGRKYYRYSSKERDDESGLYYYGLRYFLPAFGRWLSTDPVTGKDNTNLYQFIKNNPINFVDEKGEFQAPVPTTTTLPPTTTPVPGSNQPGAFWITLFFLTVAIIEEVSKATKPGPATPLHVAEDNSEFQRVFRIQWGQFLLEKGEITQEQFDDFVRTGLLNKGDWSTFRQSFHDLTKLNRPIVSYKSAWDCKPHIRGKLIESYLAGSEYRKFKNVGAWNSGFFPAIDFMNETTAVSLKTLDPLASTYDDRIDELAFHIQELDILSESSLKELSVLLDVRVPTTTPPEIIDEIQAELEYIANQYGGTVQIHVSGIDVTVPEECNLAGIRK